MSPAQNASPRSCACGTPIGRQNTSGRCRRCAAAQRPRHQLTPEQRARRAAHVRAMSADPAIVAKRGASIRETMSDPVRRQRQRDGCKRGVARKLRENPAYRDQLVAQGHRSGTPNLVIGRTAGPRARAGQSLRAHRLAWCPEEFWDLNRSLKRKGFRLAERQEIILAEVPGTPEHARRAVYSADLAGKLKHAREVAQRY